MKTGEKEIACIMKVRCMHLKKLSVQTVMKIVTAVGFAASAALCVYAWQTGLFSSPARLQSYISGFGLAGAVVFTLFQAVQVVIPILPGGISCLAGVLLFGAWRGFLYNYIGICAGSILAFSAAKLYGRPLLRCLFSEKLITKYEEWTSEKSRFAKMFAIAIFLPMAPDDFLCYLAGTTEMRLSLFTGIIMLGKPFSIALYSLGLYTAFVRFPALIGG